MLLGKYFKDTFRTIKQKLFRASNRFIDLKYIISDLFFASLKNALSIAFVYARRLICICGDIDDTA
jgi:hypothetical protein